jgi:hypothetical protein
MAVSSYRMVEEMVVYVQGASLNTIIVSRLKASKLLDHQRMEMPVTEPEIQSETNPPKPKSSLFTSPYKANKGKTTFNTLAFLFHQHTTLATAM